MRPQTVSLALRITLLALPILTATAAQAAPPPAAPTCVHTPFRGITATSEIGDLIGSPDPLDWGCTDRQGSATGSSVRTSGEPIPVPPPPSGFCLLPASPNPATTATRLRLSLGNPAHVRLVIYGETWRHGPREVYPIRTLFDAQLMPGQHEAIWDARDDGGVRVPAGIYRAVMESGADVLCGDIEIR
jgi:hypothetical protein